MVCASPLLFFLRPTFRNEEDSPPPWNSSQALGPSDIAYGAAAFVQVDRKGAPEAAHDLLSHAARCQSVEVSMNVLNRRWLFRGTC